MGGSVRRGCVGGSPCESSESGPMRGVKVPTNIGRQYNIMDRYLYLPGKHDNFQSLTMYLPRL